VFLKPNDHLRVIELAYSEVNRSAAGGILGKVNSLLDYEVPLAELEASVPINGSQLTLRCATGECLKGVGKISQIEVLAPDTNEEAIKTGSMYRETSLSGPIQQSLCAIPIQPHASQRH
jgi:hypothetical protein